MRFRLMLPLLASFTLVMGEEPVPATLAIADGAVLTSHWAITPYAQVWNDPGFAPVRRAWERTCASWLVEYGVDVPALISGFRDLRLSCDGVSANGLPRVHAQVDLGPQAGAVLALVHKRWPGSTATSIGADEALVWSASQPVLARHGGRLMLGWNCQPSPRPVQPVTADMTAKFPTALIQDLYALALPKEPPLTLGATSSIISWRMDFTHAGMRERFVDTERVPTMPAVDRVLLGRLPANTLLTFAMGLDAQPLWKQDQEAWLASFDHMLHPNATQGTMATRKEIDALIGLPDGIAMLTSELHGTILFAMTPGTPVPGLSASVPRSPAMDSLVTNLLARIDAQPPAEGTTSVLPIPELPIVLTLNRDASTWLMSSDAALSESWANGQPGGFWDAPIGKTLATHAATDAYVLGAADSAGLVRLVQHLLAMGLPRNSATASELRSATLLGLSRFAKMAQPTWIWGRIENGQSECDSEGIFGQGSVVFLSTLAIAIPKLTKGRVTADEAAAGVMLRSGFFPAQVQFQAGAYQDADGNGRGEYGTLSELSGRVAKGTRKLHFLAGPLATGTVANGYHFRIYLPDGLGGAIQGDDGPRPAAPAGASEQEQHWIAYAWPVSRESGQRILAIGEDGEVVAQTWDGSEPAWDAARSKGWDAPLTWPPYVPGPSTRPRASPKPKPEPESAPEPPATTPAPLF